MAPHQFAAYDTTAASDYLQKTDKPSKPIGYQDIRRLFGRATQVRALFCIRP
jgi:hypothetical protein